MLLAPTRWAPREAPHLQQEGAGREPREAGVGEATAPRAGGAAVLQPQRLKRRQLPCGRQQLPVSSGRLAAVSSGVYEPCDSICHAHQHQDFEESRTKVALCQCQSQMKDMQVSKEPVTGGFHSRLQHKGVYVTRLGAKSAVRLHRHWPLCSRWQAAATLTYAFQGGVREVVPADEAQLAQRRRPRALEHLERRA